MCQGGDFTFGDGKGGESIYGQKFDDEWKNGWISHSEPYLLSMVNAGRNWNASQFLITFAEADWLDKKNVVFGKVVSGQNILKKIEECGTSSQEGTPKKKVVIADCGEVKPKALKK
eukprot:gnl/MRDRNA2_/MRDRNA2_151909_c0_seq1.p1 gnl/MRDRNA2_/MRDRNA2_151909_c0~~gnl/MRDRNA2_/MRDRNA2_151909_c0_seq1.p1  ORF type:complete len:116 (-),score=27.86 gnl/MRDRNA2_/MRDRNA2_151909_c0_seq1:353-700(-)